MEKPMNNKTKKPSMTDIINYVENEISRAGEGRDPLKRKEAAANIVSVAVNEAAQFITIEMGQYVTEISRPEK